jgi:putative membrane protein (TIGR04086 family)
VNKEKFGAAMKDKEKKANKVTAYIKYLVIAYVLTGILLLALTSALYWWRFKGSVVTGCIFGIYVIVNFIGGLLAGKRAENRRFLKGLLFGVLYFLVLLIVSICVNRGIAAGNATLLYAFLACAISGMIGGMVS